MHSGVTWFRDALAWPSYGSGAGNSTARMPTRRTLCRIAAHAGVLVRAPLYALAWRHEH